jgi:hypothetical protein
LKNEQKERDKQTQKGKKTERQRETDRQREPNRERKRKERDFFIIEQKLLKNKKNIK